MIVMLTNGASIPFQRAPLLGYTAPDPPFTGPCRFGSGKPLAFVQTAMDVFLIPPWWGEESSGNIGGDREIERD
mgnify:CR=1 FL=1